MKKLMLGLMMAFASTLVKAETVAYLDYDAASGTFTNATAECTIVTSGTMAFADGGWYVVKGTNTCDGITVSGSAHLILADEAELTAGKGICVSVGNSFAIYGQGEGSGKLIAKARGTGSAAVGGAAPNRDCGAITVNGGVVEVVANVTGGSFVGIGGAMGGGHGGVVTINGGLVTVDGPIGGGKGASGGNGGDGGTLMVNGGRLTASKICGGAGGSGIGRQEPGSDGAGVKATFLGGVTAALNGIFTDGDPIVADGMKVTGDFNVASYISVGEQEGPNTRDVVFVLGGGIIGITTDFTGESLSEGNRVTLKDVEVGAKIRIIEVICAPGFEYRGATEFVVSAVEMPHELNATSLPVEVLESVEYAVPGESTLSVVRNVATVFSGPNTFTNGGWYVATARQSCGVIEVKGAANLILADGAELTVDGGIRVTEGNSLTIYGQGEGTGKLITTGAEGCAGIGGGAGDKGADGYFFGERGSNGASGGSCGVVAINGGVVAAIGGTGAAGIGGGAGGAGGSVGTFRVEGQATVAFSGGFNGADGGSGGSGGTLTINGGTVTATGGNGAAGIGGGVGGIGSAGLGEGRDGRNGENGANTTATFLGGVTEALNGIFTEGEPTLGENVEVTGRFNVSERIVVFDADAIALGHKDHPWKAGDDAKAWTNGTGRLTIEGTGAMYDFASEDDVPWADAADEVTEVMIENTVTHVGKNAFAGMTNLETINGEDVGSTYRTVSTVNGKPIDQFNMMGDALGNGPLVYPPEAPTAPSGAVSGAEPETVRIVDGKVLLGVSVCTNGDVTAATEDWEPAAIEKAQVEEDGTVTLTVPATAEQGFMLLKSKPMGK